MKIYDFPKHDLLVWVDLETTGLWDPHKHYLESIMEIGCIITDADLMEVNRFQTLVKPTSSSYMNMNSFVRTMHTDNGLIKEIESQWNDLPTPAAAELKFLSFLNEYKMDENNMYFAGNSLASLDIPFMHYYMPNLFRDKRGPIHYHSVDVTSIKIAIGLMRNRDIHYEKNGSHRAIDDCEESIKQLQCLFDNIGPDDC